MSERLDTLRSYTNDMLALTRHIQQATAYQKADTTVKHIPAVYKLIETIDATLREQQAALEAHLERFESNFFEDAKSTIAEWLGALAGVYDRLRPNTAARMLRDDYTALGLAAISYTMLHTTGLALRSDETTEETLARDTAALAVRHLEALTPLIVEISRVIPQAVNIELIEDTTAVDLDVAETATARTQAAWRSEQTERYEPIR